MFYSLVNSTCFALVSSQNDGGPLAANISASVTNTNTMVTRSKVGIHKPNLFLASTALMSIDDALQCDYWTRAMVDELTALTINKIWSLVKLPSQWKSIGCKWVFKVKENSDGTILRHKARFAQGFTQREGLDFHETFSLVVKPTINNKDNVHDCYCTEAHQEIGHQ